MSKAKKNRKYTDFSIGEQFPAAIEEKGKPLLQFMKEVKANNPSTNCKLVVDKLFINGEKNVNQNINPKQVSSAEDVIG